MDLFKSFVAIPLSAVLFIACSNAAGNNSGRDGASASSTANTGDSVYAGNTSLSYNIGNRHVAIKNYLKKGNQNFVALFLNKVKNDAAAGMARVNLTNYLTFEVFDFAVANKGTTTISHYSPSLFETKTKGTYMSPKYKNYYADSVTVTITDINATHIAGIFSGKFLSSDDKPLATYITDGKFDVTYTKDTDN